MKKCDGQRCNRRTPEKIQHCCEECEMANRDKNNVPDAYMHSAICDAREAAALGGHVVPSRPEVPGGKFPDSLLTKE